MRPPTKLTVQSYRVTKYLGVNTLLLLGPLREEVRLPLPLLGHVILWPPFPQKSIKMTRSPELQYGGDKSDWN